MKQIIQQPSVLRYLSRAIVAMVQCSRVFRDVSASTLPHVRFDLVLDTFHSCLDHHEVYLKVHRCVSLACFAFQTFLQRVRDSMPTSDGVQQRRWVCANDLRRWEALSRTRGFSWLAVRGRDQWDAWFRRRVELDHERQAVSMDEGVLPTQRTRGPDTTSAELHFLSDLILYLHEIDDSTFEDDIRSENASSDEPKQEATTHNNNVPNTATRNEIADISVIEAAVRTLHVYVSNAKNIKREAEDMHAFDVWSMSSTFDANTQAMSVGSFTTQSSFLS